MAIDGEERTRGEQEGLKKRPAWSVEDGEWERVGLVGRGWERGRRGGTF
jgi:hypothetical protein